MAVEHHHRHLHSSLVAALTNVVAVAVVVVVVERLLVERWLRVVFRCPSSHVSTVKNPSGVGVFTGSLLIWLEKKKFPRVNGIDTDLQDLIRIP